MSTEMSTQETPMLHHWLSRLGLAAVVITAAAMASCDDGDLPSDTTTTSTTTVTSGSGGNGGSGAAGGTTSTTGSGGAGPTSGSGGSGGSGGAPDCVMNPQTHVEIINACTDAEHIDKQSDLPLLNPDGSLPDLP